MDTIKIPAEPSDMTSDAVYAQCELREGEREIDPETARVIASWWQSSGTVGSALAALASGVEISRDAVLTDIYHSRKEAQTPRDRLALDMLGTFVINYGRGDR